MILVRLVVPCVLPWVLTCGCRVDLAEVGRSQASGEVAADPATPPPAPGPVGEKVYQMLYAGEFGVDARAAGDRVRILAWMAAAGFSAVQLDDMIGQAHRMRAFNAAEAAEMAAVGLREQANMAPIYAEMARLYAAGAKIEDATLAPFAPRLESARAAAAAGDDPRARHYAHLFAQLRELQVWAAALPEAQRHALADSRFFLARRFGPLTDPGDYGKWMGTAWNGADFASLRTAGRPVDEGEMEIGGLWTSEDAADGGVGVSADLRVAILLAFALEMDGFIEAARVRQGRRDPDDFSPESVPVP